MSESTTRRLTAALERLQLLYPTMRFGQLVCFATELARDQRDYEVYSVEDSDLLTAVERHLRERLSNASDAPERKVV